MSKATKNAAGMFEVEVDGQKYEFEKWGAEDSLTTLIRISKIAGKPLALAITAIVEGKPKEEKLFAEKKDLLDIELSPHLVALIVDSLTGNLDESVCVALIKKLASDRVLCDGVKINFNSHYQDRLNHLFKVVSAALEVQYGNFFGALLGLLPKGKAMAIANRNPLT